MDDDELVRRARSGDKEALALLFVRHREVVWGLAYCKLGNRTDADDATQDTFMKAHMQLHSFRASGSFKAWLMRICRNVCHDRWRSFKPTLFLECLDQDQLAHRTSSVDAADWMTVRSALRKLPRNEAVAWFLIEVLGCTSQEAAEYVGVSAASTMRSRQQNAVEKLRLELGRDSELVPADPETTAVCGLYHAPPQRAIVASVSARTARPHAPAPRHPLNAVQRLVVTRSSEGTGWTLLKFFDALDRAVPGGQRVIVVLDSDPGTETARWRGRHARWELRRAAGDDAWRQHVERLLTCCVAASCRQDVGAILALIDVGERFLLAPEQAGASS